MKETKQQIEEKIQKLDNQIDYMLKVSRERKKPQEVRKAAEESLFKLLKERDILIDSLSD